MCNATGCPATGEGIRQSERTFFSLRESDYSARAASIADKLATNLEKFLRLRYRDRECFLHLKESGCFVKLPRTGLRLSRQERLGER